MSNDTTNQIQALHPLHRRMLRDAFSIAVQSGQDDFHDAFADMAIRFDLDAAAAVDFFTFDI